VVSNRIKNVLVFDSGVGGLSVYQEVKQQMPHFNYTYVFDNEAYPYGELAPETLIKRVSKVVMDFVDLHCIDVVVIACNTASTIVLPTLRSQHSIPIVGVVPAIKPASLLANKAVGLIATPATVTRQYTHDLIKNFSSKTNVELLGSTRLVDIAEDKLRGVEVSSEELVDILKPLVNQIDVAVLGCTHFPLIRDEIQTVLGSEVILVDSGKAIANRVKDLMQVGWVGEKEGSSQIFCSAPPIEESALNYSLKKLGFTPVQIHPILGV